MEARAKAFELDVPGRYRLLLPHRARHPTVHNHDLPGDGGCRDEHDDLRRDVFRLAHTAEYCLAPCTGRDSIG